MTIRRWWLVSEPAGWMAWKQAEWTPKLANLFTNLPMVQTVGSKTGKKVAPRLTYLLVVWKVGFETAWVDGFKTGWVDANTVVACFKTRQRMHIGYHPNVLFPRTVVQTCKLAYGVEVIWQFEITLWILKDCRTHNLYAYLIFSLSHSCFVLFSFCHGFISANSIRRVWVSWLYKETLTLQKSYYRDQFYHLFRGRLTSQYQVDWNQQTPLVIVQIVLNPVTPSLVQCACRTHFLEEHCPSRINCAEFGIQFSPAATLNRGCNIWSFGPDTQRDTLSGQLSCELIDSLIWQLAVFSYSLLKYPRLRIFQLPGDEGAWFMHQSCSSTFASTHWKLSTL